MNHTSILNFPVSIFRFFPLKLKLNFKLFWVLSIVLIIILSIFYIFQINSLTSKAYQIQNSQKKINELSFENERLEIKLARLNSLVNIKNLVEKFNFEKADKIHYIQISENQIVKE